MDAGSTVSSQQRMILVSGFVGVMFQTLVYGMYAVIVAYASTVMIKKGTKAFSRKVLLYSMFWMFSLSTVYWVATIIWLFDKYARRGLPQGPQTWPANANSEAFPMMSAILILNYVATDAIIIWRAYVLCDTPYRKAMYIPIAFWCVLCVASLGCIGLRATAIHQKYQGIDESKTETKLDVFQYIALFCTIFVNFSSTIIVAVKAWKRRRAVRDFMKAAGTGMEKSQKILTALVDSGIFYVLCNIVLLATTLVRLPDNQGTLGDIYGTINVQIAGIYPTLVFLLVSRQWKDSDHVESSTMFSSIPRSSSGVRQRQSVSEFIARPGTRGSAASSEIEFTDLEPRRATFVVRPGSDHDMPSHFS